MSKEVAEQLYMVHDPFAETTTQPKIPDGKVSSSLGFSSSIVSEIIADPGEGVMHMLLFAGQNAGLVIRNMKKLPGNVGGDSAAGRPWRIEQFSGSGVCDWSDCTTSSFPTIGMKSGVVKNQASAQYALWRVVSQGLQLKLLNGAETDDGWWEAIRVNREYDTNDYSLTTCDDSTDPAEAGVCAPLDMLAEATGGTKPAFLGRTISNDPSYSTGLLRDLDKVQFELHGRLDYHDFTVKKQNQAIIGTSFETPDAALQRVGFALGQDDAFEIINNFIDMSYDMVYIRLHCRSDAANPTRFHTNVISNQEVYFEDNARENRYQTPSQSIGANSMSIHLQGRRASSHAAQFVGS